VVDALAAEIPDVLHRLVGAGATVVEVAGGRYAALRCRRSVFERALWDRAAAEPGVRMVAGHVDDVVTCGGRAVGVRIGPDAPDVVDADCVIDASGRASRLARAWRPDEQRFDCGATYVGRQYRLHPTAAPGPMNSVIGLSLSFPEYAAVVFVHDSDTFTVTLIHRGDDARMQRLRHDAVFTAAMAAIPGVADWIEPDRATPIGSVLPGGKLYNRYRGQLTDDGRPVLPGLVSVGDAVCTTTPLAGRGVALNYMQARELVRLITHEGSDIDSVTTEFDAWCTANIRPWFVDHQDVDGERVRRWAGHDVDLTRPLPSDLIVAAADVDPALHDVVGPYVTMDALPASLAPARTRAVEIYASGWRPAMPAGPTLDELTAVVTEMSELSEVSVASVASAVSRTPVSA
jgi:hypothetical protein